MLGLQQKLVSLAVALALGATCFVLIRWAFAAALTVGHKPQDPITIARIFSAPKSSWSGKLPGQAYRWGVVDGTEADPVLRFRSLETNFSPDDIHAFFGASSLPLQGRSDPNDIVQGMLKSRIGSQVFSLPPLPKLLPHMKLSLPTEMKTTADGTVEAEIVLLGSTLTPEMSEPPKLSGAAAAFEITGPVRPSNLSWKWNVLAKGIGNSRTLTIEFPSSAKFDYKFESSPSERLTIKGKVVTASVDIRDEFGLTQAQRTGGIVLASIISALGTVFGYPFVKGRLEPKPSPPAEKPAAKKKHR